ncbi:potassium transporter [Lentinula raphanica]|nr:potassium transporter [Lentinula raphanica]
MPPTSEAEAKPPSGDFVSRFYDRAETFILYECSFFRLHLFAFVFMPLIISAIFWGCNGRYSISYLDSLFLCYSAMTETGLSTVNLSTLTAWQQVILYLLMMMVRLREYFKRRCEYEYVRISKRRKYSQDHTKLRKARESVPLNNSNNKPVTKKFNEVAPTIPTFNLRHPTSAPTFDLEKVAGTNAQEESNSNTLYSNQGVLHSSPEAMNIELPAGPISSSSGPHSAEVAYSTPLKRANTFRTTPGVPLRRTATVLTHRSQNPNVNFSTPKHQYNLGFPGPALLVQKAFRAISPNAYQKMARKLTIPYSQTIEGDSVPWLTSSDKIIVGRNSDFRVDTLSDELVEQIGGVEYVALRWLSYIVPMYFICTQLISFIIFTPWLCVTHKYDVVFESQFRIINKPWFSLFQVMGAYTGGGLSLVDDGMVPFQSAYLMVFALMFVMLAGNQGFVSFHFLLISKETLSKHIWLLLVMMSDIYIIIILNEHILSSPQDIGLEVWTALSIGPRIIMGLFQGMAAASGLSSIVDISALAPAMQFVYAVMMYCAVSCQSLLALFWKSNFVSFSYEELSLGVFEAQPDFEEDPISNLGNGNGTPRQRVARYLGWHLRQQLSIDLWWLVWGMFLIAIIERDNLLNDDLKWFDLFRILFELVSAFSGIGLSLGIPTENYSFVGAMHTLSKLVIIVIMVRGRHRGLPIAVDRAVMLPEEEWLKRPDAEQTNAGTGNAYNGTIAEEVDEN